MSEVEKKVDEVQPEERQETMAELFARLRKMDVVLEDGTVRKAEIRELTTDEARNAEAYARVVISQKAKGETDPITGMVLDKLPTKDNMMEDAKAKGLWTAQDDIDFTTLQAQIRTKEDKLRMGKMKKTDAHPLTLELIQHRKDIAPYNRTRWDIYNMTADAAGEDAMHKYICVASAIWEDGTRIFPNMAAWDAGGDIRAQVYNHYMLILSLQNEVMTPWNVEIAFLKKFGYLDDEGNIYDADKKTVIMNINQKDEAQGEWVFYEDDGETVAQPVELKAGG